MAVIRSYKPGEFCWTDLGTTDVAGARKFYQSIFGAKVMDVPMGIGDAKYSILQVDGKDTCAIYPMQDEQRKMNAAPFWLPFVSVDNVDKTVKKSKAAGGKLGLGPIDVMDSGRMAIIIDPTGAAVAIWQAGTHKGAELRGTPGTVCWHDLNTPKPAVAGKFYTKVFGWATEDKSYSGNAYHLFKLGKKGVCGMWPEPMKGLPPSWLTYWQVANCARTVAKIKQRKGRVLMGTTLVPGMCRFAIAKDPQGATFGILEPEE